MPHSSACEHCLTRTLVDYAEAASTLGIDGVPYMLVIGRSAQQGDFPEISFPPVRGFGSARMHIQGLQVYIEVDLAKISNPACMPRASMSASRQINQRLRFMESIN